MLLTELQPRLNLEPARELRDFSSSAINKYMHVFGLANFLNEEALNCMSPERTMEYRKYLESSSGRSSSSPAPNYHSPAPHERRKSVQFILKKMLSALSPNTGRD